MHRTHLKSHARTSVGPPLVLIAPPSFDATLPVNAQFVKSASPYSTATAPPPLGPSAVAALETNEQSFATSDPLATRRTTRLAIGGKGLAGRDAIGARVDDVDESIVGLDERPCVAYRGRFGKGRGKGRGKVEGTF